MWVLVWSRFEWKSMGRFDLRLSSHRFFGDGIFVHVGVGKLHHLWWLPLGLGALVRRKNSGMVLVLCRCRMLVFAMISCFYLGFFLAMATLLWSIFTFWEGKKTPKLILKCCIVRGIAIAIVLPITKVSQHRIKWRC